MTHQNYSPPKKYKGYRVANTGLDPHGGFLEFIKKDIIKNIDVQRDSDNARQLMETKRTSYEANRSKWAIGCTKDTVKKVNEEGQLLP